MLIEKALDLNRGQQIWIVSCGLHLTKCAQRQLTRVATHEEQDPRLEKEAVVAKGCDHRLSW